MMQIKGVQGSDNDEAQHPFDERVRAQRLSSVGRDAELRQAQRRGGAHVEGLGGAQPVQDKLRRR